MPNCLKAGLWFALFYFIACGEVQAAPSSIIPAYHVERLPVRYALATHTMTVKGPFQGWAYFPKVFNHDVQQINSVIFRVDGKEVIPETVAISEGRYEGKKIRLSSSQDIRVSVEIKALMFERSLKEGSPSKPPIPLSAEGRKFFTASLWPEVYEIPEWPEFLDHAGLRRLNKEDPVDFAARVIEWMRKNLKYGASKKGESAYEVIQGGGGQCNQNSFVFDTILRSNGIPARAIGGYLGYEDDSPGSGHMRSEFWVDGVGWIPVEATGLMGEEQDSPIAFRDDADLVLTIQNAIIHGQGWGGFNVRGFQFLPETGFTAKVIHERNLCTSTPYFPAPAPVELMRESADLFLIPSPNQWIPAGWQIGDGFWYCTRNAALTLPVKPTQYFDLWVLMKANNDAILSATPTSEPDASDITGYVAVIGGWNNSRSVMRLLSTERRSYTNLFLTPNQPFTLQFSRRKNGFWVLIDGKPIMYSHDQSPETLIDRLSIYGGYNGQQCVAEIRYRLMKEDD